MICPTSIHPPFSLPHTERSDAPTRQVLVGAEGGALRRPALAPLGLGWEESARGADVADLLRVHDEKYLAHARASVASVGLAERRAQLDAAIAARGLAARGLGGGGEGEDDAADGGAVDARAAMRCFDTDTKLSGASWTAAVDAAGAAILAVDRVVAGDCRAAFVATRPPGHHAGLRGAVPAHHFWRRPDMCSCGFCLVNNVAVAAAYARSRSVRSLLPPSPPLPLLRGAARRRRGAAPRRAAREVEIIASRRRRDDVIVSRAAASRGTAARRRRPRRRASPRHSRRRARRRLSRRCRARSRARWSSGSRSSTLTSTMATARRRSCARSRRAACAARCRCRRRGRRSSGTRTRYPEMAAERARARSGFRSRHRSDA